MAKRFTTLVPYPTSVYPTPYTYVDDVPYYTAMDRYAAYAHEHGTTVEAVLTMEAQQGVDIRDIELGR